MVFSASRGAVCISRLICAVPCGSMTCYTTGTQVPNKCHSRTATMFDLVDLRTQRPQTCQVAKQVVRCISLLLWITLSACSPSVILPIPSLCTYSQRTEPHLAAELIEDIQCMLSHHAAAAQTSQSAHLRQLQSRAPPSGAWLALDPHPADVQTPCCRLLSQAQQSTPAH